MRNISREKRPLEQLENSRPGGKKHRDIAPSSLANRPAILDSKAASPVGIAIYRCPYPPCDHLGFLFLLARKQNLDTAVEAFGNRSAELERLGACEEVEVHRRILGEKHFSENISEPKHAFCRAEIA